MKFYPLILVTILFQSESLFAGTIRGSSLNMSVGQEYLADGEMIASREINLKCGGVFRGEGLVKAPVIDIKTKKFEFTGTIECDGICTITVKEPFNEKQLTRAGNGHFTIVVEEQLDLEKKDSNFDMPTINPTLRTPPMPMTARSMFDRPVTPTTSVPERVVKKGNFTFTFKGEAMLALVDAIEKNDSNAFKSFLVQNPSMQADRDRITILMLFAGLSGQLEIAKECIDLGADVNGRQSGVLSNTYLVIAIDSNSNDFAKLLIESGAKTNEIGRDLRMALHYAANYGHADVVQALILAGAPVNATDTDWRTPLMYAADKGHLAVVKLLLDAGADKDKTDRDRLTAINYVNRNEHKELFELLNEKKSAITQINKENHYLNPPLSENNVQGCSLKENVNSALKENEKKVSNGLMALPIIKEFLNLPIQVKLISVVASGVMVYHLYKDCKRLGWI